MSAVPDPRKKIRITVDLDPASHRALKITAAQTGMTISDIVRIGLSGFVRRVAEGERPQPRPHPVPARTPRSVWIDPAPEPVSLAAVVAEIAAEARGEQHPNPFAAVLDPPDLDA